MTDATSPDLTPSDHYLYPNLKKDEELKATINVHFSGNDGSYFL